MAVYITVEESGVMIRHTFDDGVMAVPQDWECGGEPIEQYVIFDIDGRMLASFPLDSVLQIDASPHQAPAGTGWH